MLFILCSFPLSGEQVNYCRSDAAMSYYFNTIYKCLSFQKIFSLLLLKSNSYTSHLSLSHQKPPLLPVLPAKFPRV